MGFPASLILIAVGAILAFAVNQSDPNPRVDIDVVGWILMAAGALGLVITMVVWGGRRRTVVTNEPTTYRRVDERTDVGPGDPL